MDAEIWLGKPDAALGYFGDNYNSLTLLNYLGLYYQADLQPLLNDDGSFPLEQNAWLLSELQRQVAERLEAPNATEQARVYLYKCGMEHLAVAMINVWRTRAQELIRLLERSTQIGVPLTMSL